MTVNSTLSRYSVRELLQAEIGVVSEDHLTLQPSFLQEMVGITVDQTVDFGLEWALTKEGLDLVTSATPTVEFECGRCLTKIKIPVEGKGEFLFERLGKSPESNKIKADLTVDLMQPIIDTIVPAIPTYPLCRPDCQGLCPTCGINLNQHPDHLKLCPSHAKVDPPVNKIKFEK